MQKVVTRCSIHNLLDFIDSFCQNPSGDFLKIFSRHQSQFALFPVCWYFVKKNCLEKSIKGNDWFLPGPAIASFPGGFFDIFIYRVNGFDWALEHMWLTREGNSYILSETASIFRYFAQSIVPSNVKGPEVWFYSFLGFPLSISEFGNIVPDYLFNRLNFSLALNDGSFEDQYFLCKYAKIARA